MPKYMTRLQCIQCTKLLSHILHKLRRDLKLKVLCRQLLLRDLRRQANSSVLLRQIRPLRIRSLSVVVLLLRILLNKLKQSLINFLNNNLLLQTFQLSPEKILLLQFSEDYSVPILRAWITTNCNLLQILLLINVTSANSKSSARHNSF